jgi:hypothetical protein
LETSTEETTLKKYEAQVYLPDSRYGGHLNACTSIEIKKTQIISSAGE